MDNSEDYIQAILANHEYSSNEATLERLMVRRIQMTRELKEIDNRIAEYIRRQQIILQYANQHVVNRIKVAYAT
jgi:hypothetical protein